MAVLLAIWVLVLTSVHPSAAMPFSTTIDGSVSPNSAESSGSLESDTSATDVSFTSTETSTFISSTNSIITNEPTTSKPVTVAAAIMDFIQQHMNLIIIAGVLLILLIVIVCTVILVKQNYNASAYYPSSYPKKKYVDEQDRGGSAKTFNEIPEKVNEESKEDGGSSSEQLQADIRTATHNLKKKSPSKSEADAAEQGEPAQSPDKEGGSTTPPGAGEKERGGQTSDTTENKGNKAPEMGCKEGGSDKLPKEKEPKGGGEGDKRGNKEHDDEPGKTKGAKKKSESGGDSSTNCNQQSASGKLASEQVADTAGTKGVNNVVSSEGQKPKEVKLAQQGFSEASNVAEPSADVNDLEKTPLIPNLNGVPNDSTAF
ncbi:transmembrane protein 119b [Scyliorhinus canicula]|uniref:transmembrane protein 119b n=1 Tax=Scyliorhinus canicula TaxID=7830 RepID=UPI0018F54C1D|nr:transmembrane protein 119b [Scyliorhinus canicula]XP_038675710.1 transmembrane protein 119b [Scyliorhinus canicula]XP_038675797.1 transmembrane protein 119b [Scyliorhinus canicula]